MATCVISTAWSSVVVSRLFLLATVLVLTVAKSSVKWEKSHVERKQGESLQVMCTVSELDWLSVVRVEKHDEERKTTMIIADNNDVKQPFSQLSRYNVRFQLIDDIGTVSIYYQGIRGEDAGTLVCYKNEDNTREEDKARLELKVLVPIQSVQLFSISSDGRETIVDSHAVTLTETSLTDLEDTGGPPTRRGGGSGVACVAAVNGSLSPPDVRIMMDNGDVTRMFVAREQSRILEDPESAGPSGLGFYYGERRMSYVTAMPETSWNGQMLTCVAAQEGFPDESVFAIVVVKYIPQIACKSHDVVAEMGDHVTLSCEVRASPSATVDWYFGTGNETLDNSTDVDSWTVATKPLVNDEGVKATLDIAQLVPARLGVYRINARNSVGASEEKVTIRRRDRSSDSRRDSSAVSGNGRPGYSHSGRNGHTESIARWRRTALLPACVVIAFSFQSAVSSFLQHSIQ